MHAFSTNIVALDAAGTNNTGSYLGGDHLGHVQPPTAGGQAPSPVMRMCEGQERHAMTVEVAVHACWSELDILLHPKCF